MIAATGSELCAEAVKVAKDTVVDEADEAHFVSEDDAARKRVAAGEQGGIDLMRIEIHLGIDQRRGQRLHGVACRAAGEQPGDVLALVWRQGLRGHQWWPSLDTFPGGLGSPVPLQASFLPMPSVGR
ncbi:MULTISPECIES: hypothetical protein [unclassified Methylococcus]|uniref:hypothetical protein n=1 Tax=unclassified Methylococcus TaxID=2618889 RepID=UPI003D7F1528